MAVLLAAVLVLVTAPPVHDWWRLRTSGARTEGIVTGLRDGARGDHLTVQFVPPGRADPVRADLLVRDAGAARVGSTVQFRFDPRQHSNVAPLGYDARMDFALLMVLALGLLVGVCARESLRGTQA